MWLWVLFGLSSWRDFDPLAGAAEAAGQGLPLSTHIGPVVALPARLGGAVRSAELARGDRHQQT